MINNYCIHSIIYLSFCAGLYNLLLFLAYLQSSLGHSVQQCFYESPFTPCQNDSIKLVLQTLKQTFYLNKKLRMR